MDETVDRPANARWHFGTCDQNTDSTVLRGGELPGRKRLGQHLGGGWLIQSRRYHKLYEAPTAAREAHPPYPTD